MLKRFAQLAGLTLLLGLVFVPAAHAGPHFSFSVGVGPSYPIAPYAGRNWGGERWERERRDERWEHERRNFDRDRSSRHDRDRRDRDRGERGSWRR
jgi:hypothetical protein